MRSLDSQSDRRKFCARGPAGTSIMIVRGTLACHHGAVIGQIQQHIAPHHTQADYAYFVAAI
jgi:hypothetical protein